MVREMSRRERAPFAVRDDRDLDDLMRALLPIQFDDVRPLARTPRYAGNRGACLLSPEDIVVVSHLVERGLDEKALLASHAGLPINFSRSIARPRASRDITVPIGAPVAAAISR